MLVADMCLALDHLPLSIEKNHSIRFIHDAETGVKWVS